MRRLPNPVLVDLVDKLRAAIDRGDMTDTFWRCNDVIDKVEHLREAALAGNVALAVALTEPRQYAKFPAA